MPPSYDPMEQCRKSFRPYDPDHPIRVGRSDWEIEQDERKRDREGLKAYGIFLSDNHFDGYDQRRQKQEMDEDRSEVIKPWELSISHQMLGTGDPPPFMPNCHSVETWDNSEGIVEIRDGIFYLTLNRPEANNAMNDGIGAAIHDAILILRKRPDIRIAVLTGNGRMFCAGGDPKSFQAAQAAAGAISGEGGGKSGPPPGAMITGMAKQFKSNSASANMFAWDMYHWATLPQFTIGCANGSAMGGGVGLLSICDYVVGVKTAMISLSEVKLGVIPAVISPHVMRTIGMANAKRLFCTAENCNMQMCKEMGFVQQVVDDVSGFPAIIKEVAQKVQACAPGAIAASKQVMLNSLNQPMTDNLMNYTCDMYLKTRRSPECEEGMKALEAKKKPSWVEKNIDVKS